MERDLESFSQLLLTTKVINDALGEVQLPIIDEWIVDAVADALVVVDTSHPEALATRYDRRGGVSIDRSAQDHTSPLVTIRWNIGSPTTETDSQRRPGPNQHCPPSSRHAENIATCSKFEVISFASAESSLRHLSAG